MWPTLIFSGIACAFLAMALSALWHLRWVQPLPSLASLTSLTPSGSPEGPIRCSVVIAARDEASRVERTIRHLLAQRGVELDITVVDDRSVDGTSEILARLAAQDGRLRVKRVDVLPTGWLGKCHACHLGAADVTGDWILFTDADCWLKPDVIERAVRVAGRDGADHITLAPGTDVKSLATRGWHLLFLTSILNWFSGVNRDRPKAHVGIGAFNLVGAATYRQCGGYEALRLTVLDDVKLGLLVRRAGKKTRAFLGFGDVECHWGSSVGGMVKIMEKNYFAALEFRLSVVLAGSTTVALVCVALLLGLLAGSWIGLMAALSPLALVLPGSVLARRLGWGWTCALAVPWMIPVFWYAMLNSTWVTLRQGGVRWRETFYPLEILRAGNVR